MHLNPFVIAQAAYSVDIDARTELSHQLLAGEDDYISTFTARLRGLLHRNGLATASLTRKLQPGEEQKLGCDVIIVIRSANVAKVCLFEAKWPRISVRSYGWDYRQKNSGISHFSDQLSRQHMWHHVAAVWELFMVEAPHNLSPPEFDPLGSTCVWHDEALAYDQSYRTTSLWRTADVVKLLQSIGAPGNNIDQMIQQVINCERGNRLRIVQGNVELTALEGDDRIKIPVAGSELGERIRLFCQGNGLRAYLQISVDEMAA